MEGSRTLSELGLTAAVNRPQNPGSFVAAWTDEEVTAQTVICKLTPSVQVEVTPYSLPPELPEVMKPPLETEAAAQEISA